MNKELLISIHPQHAVNILNGKKTLELRTWIPKGYVGWVYVYVTKGKRLSVVHDDENGKTYYYLNSNWGRSLNQDIPFRFWFDEFTNYSYHVLTKAVIKNGEIEFEEAFDNVDLVEKSCVNFNEIDKYTNFGKKKLYAWHIKRLEVFDEPKSLSDFYVLYGGEESFYPLKKAPQKMTWVYVKEQ